MLVRILIGGFASIVSGLGFITGLTRLMSGLLLGFGTCCSFFFALIFFLPVDSKRLLLPVYEPVPFWPYLLLGTILAALTVSLFYFHPKPLPSEPIAGKHFKYLLGGVAGYLLSIFVPSVFWFPSDKTRIGVQSSVLAWEVLLGTGLFLVGVSFSSYLLYRATRGGSDKQPDLMRRFVLGLFAFMQLDKVPLLVTYLLIYAPDSQVIFPNIGALALCSYLPVAALLMRATWDNGDLQELS
jgi:hypothetical protein